MGRSGGSESDSLSQLASDLMSSSTEQAAGEHEYLPAETLRPAAEGGHRHSHSVMLTKYLYRLEMSANVAHDWPTTMARW